MQALARWVTLSPCFDVHGWTRRVVLVVLFVAAAHGRQAWAIDCASATSTIDRTICSTPELLREDQFLNGAYSQAMQMLSPEGQSALRTDQRTWLKYRAKACGFDDAATTASNERCLYYEIDRRNRVVWAKIVRQQVPRPLVPSPYLFTWHSMYDSIPDASGAKPLITESDTPQIDQNSKFAEADWPDAKKWNDLITKLIGGPEKSSFCPGGNGDVFKESWILRASAQLIVVGVRRSDSCHGHSYYIPEHDISYNMVMTPGHVHELVPADLFLPGNAWREVFIGRLRQTIKDTQSHMPCDGCNWHPSEADFERVILNPRNWAFKRKGDDLEITINRDMLPHFFTDPIRVVISSTDMQGILSVNGQQILSSPNLSSPAW